MTTAQLCLNFDAPPAAPRPGRKQRQTVTPVPAAQAREEARHQAYWAAKALAEKQEARAYWKAGMVTSLPLFSEIEGVGCRYTQMLPSVIETVDSDLASVRIYAAPEYGCWMENYPLHKQLAINVPLTELGKFHGNDDLQRLVDEDRLATGWEQLAAEVRARHVGLAVPREFELAGGI
jgi:hypothetical protein